MSDPSKVLVFGSFTEDETRTLPNQTSATLKKPVEKKELQVNSNKLVSELTFGSFNSISIIQLGSSNGQVGSHSSDIQKGIKAVDVKSARDLLPKHLTENGSFPKSAHSNSNGNEEMTNGTNTTVSGISENECKMPTKFSSLELPGDYDDSKLNGIVSNSSIEAKNEKALLKVDGPVSAVGDILPRGLINSGNLCFLNATLQALLSCSPFVQLLQGLRNSNIPKVGYPTLAAFAEFIGQFDMPVGANTVKKNVTILEMGRSFRPTMFEVVLKNFTPDVSSSISGRPRQEDAQEFLSFIMHQMHDELLKLEGQSSSKGRESSLVSATEDDGWETVGPKNKSAVTRTQSFVPSELSSIFGGQLRSVVRARGNKASATVQPFLLLHLDISHEAVHTVEDTLRLFSAPETLEYRTSTTGKAAVVDARKSVNIQALPKILVLHLMRFGYGSHGSTKLSKPVRFPLELVLSRDLLVSSTTDGRQFELVSTVTHHGREASKGHYTADALYPNGQWLRFDDASVTAISTSKVLHDHAYVLFFKQL